MDLWLLTRRGFSLVDDSGSSRGDDHTSIAGPYPFHAEPNLPSNQSFYSAQLSKSHFSRYSRSPISQEPKLACLKSIILKKIQPFISTCPFSSSYLPPTVCPPEQCPVTFRRERTGRIWKADRDAAEFTIRTDTFLNTSFAFWQSNWSYLILALLRDLIYQHLRLPNK